MRGKNSATPYPGYNGEMTPPRIFHSLKGRRGFNFLQIRRFFAKHSLPFFLLTIPLTWTGCFFGQYGGYTHLSPSVGSDTSSPDEDFLYLDLNEGFYDSLGIEPPLYELNTTENYGPSEQRDSVSNCEFLYDEEDPADPEIICILDYMEQEFLTYDLSIVLNVPRGMCTHLTTYPAWHYNLPAGFGRPVIQYHAPPEGSTLEAQYCPLGVERGRPGCSTEALDLCPYIYESFGGGEGERTNCCVGTYETRGGDRDSSANSWGGSVTDCLGGPGRTSWDRYDRYGWPARRVEYVLEDGLRRTFDITNLIETARGGAHSTPIANYLERLNVSVDDLLEGNIELPLFFHHTYSTPTVKFPLDRNTPYPHRIGNPFFTFNCLDGGGETLFKINLMFREWNTYEEFIAFYDSGGGDETADPDVPGKSWTNFGQEGDDCDYEERLSFVEGSRCNDYLDMDDIAPDYVNVCNVTGYPCARYGGGEE